VAAALNLPLNTVRTHLHRGRKRMGERLRARMGVRETAAVGEEIVADFTGVRKPAAAGGRA
jgi:hypothetical protein